ncbi:glycosyltransferase family 2 protein [Phocaeicola paurosaccharolyticus]|uniref:glycosyltransferase n=1 Tax=Phocaeicola paurosaccharolyticus TaxID=732242 RepID=UPI002FE37C99
MTEFLNITFAILFIYFAICILYIFVFSFASFFFHPIEITKKNISNKFAILIPSYREDDVIDDSVDSLISQSYSNINYDIHVISDSMLTETNERLIRKRINLHEVKFENSSKAKSLKYVSKILHNYDYVIILDADNIVPYNYIEDINSFVSETGCIALQTHRQSKNINNNISYMDSVIEEMNNSIYRKGHNAINISSSIIGSGVALDYKWFIENVQNLESTGEDKEIEELLLKQNHFIYYNEDIIFKDEKVSNKKSIKYQRRRWIGTQFNLLKLLLLNLLSVIKKGNINYIIKIIETIILPKSLLIGFLAITTLIITIISPIFSIVWWGMLILLLASLYVAIPKYLRDKRLIIALSNLPHYFMMMFVNLFKIKSANKSFIHTQHGN